MTSEQLDELERVARAATPGPWDYVMHGPQPTVFRPDQTVVCDLYRGYDLPIGRPEANASYIAAANPDAVLALIARVRELESDLQSNAAMLARQCDLAREAETDRDRLAAEVAQLTADLESHDVETQRRIATLTREFNESYTRLAAKVERLRAMAREVVARYDGYRARGVMPAPDEYAAMVAGINALRAALAEAPTPAREEGQ